MDIIQQIKSRWNPAWDAKYGSHKSTFEHIIIALQAPTYQRAKFAKDDRLSEKGVSEEVRNILAKNVIPRLKHDAASTAKARQALKDERAALGNIKVDPTDFAAALRRQEARALMKTMSLADQSALLLVNGDRFMIEAILEMPPLFSGVPDDIWSRAQEAYVQKHFAAHLSDIAEQDEMLKTVEMAGVMATNTIKSESGFKNSAEASKWFDEVAA